MAKRPAAVNTAGPSWPRHAACHIARVRSRLLTIVALAAVLAVMGTLTAYSVTLYRLFCAATGAGGTVTRAEAAPGAAGRAITVRFDTSVAPGFPWDFAPKAGSVRAVPGAGTLAFFEATNRGPTALAGHATFNVTPEKAAIYFKKIQCFCFNEERLGPGEHAEMPVTFFVDPRIRTDPATADVDEITLSYTFFPSRRPADALPLGHNERAARGEALFAAQCQACHAWHEAKIGPPLDGVPGRRAGSVAGYPYSPALRGADFTWTEPRLDAWLADPQKAVPGAAMPVHVADPEARRDIIRYLASRAAE
jgi:cytochrome c oxidase assembly protein subunit 11